MTLAKGRRSRWVVVLAIMTLVVAVAGFFLFALPRSAPLEEGPSRSLPPIDATPPPSGGALPGQPKEAANGGGPTEPGPSEPEQGYDLWPDGEEPTAPGPQPGVDYPPQPPPADMPALPEPPAPGLDGPGEPPSPPPPAPAPEPVPAEPPPLQGEGGFGEYDKAFENGGGGGSTPVAVEEPGAGAPADEPVVRFPYLDAPETVAPGGRIEVTVALTLDALTPGVTARPAPGGKLTAEGALDLRLPTENDQWEIDVDLIAPGFDAADGSPLQRRIVLYRDNDSDFARFPLALRAGAKAGEEKRLAARFYHAGRFLGSAMRPIRIADASARPSALSSAQPPSRAEPIAVDAAGETPDMDVLLLFDDPANPRRAMVVVHSPHIAGPVTGVFDLPAGAPQWIEGNFAQLVSLGQRLRGARSLTVAPAEDDPVAQRQRTIAFAEGFGEELYRRYTPDEFRRVFEQLRREGVLKSLLVSSNSSTIPWELAFAPAEGPAPGGFLGLTYRLGRWTPRDGGDRTDRPGAEIVFDGVATVAPHYRGRQALPFQQREIDALSALSGFAPAGGDYAAFEALVRDPLRRFVHFSGHGAVGDPQAGEAPFAILLEDQSIDPTTWRRIAGAGAPGRRPFYFFNACDSGAARVIGGFVQGWGTTVLESGASGFIGGMWPLADEAAATFAAEYYGLLVKGLATDRVRVADVLREVRQGFYASGDPTFLAYTFYGDPNLTVTPSPP